MSYIIKLLTYYDTHVWQLYEHKHNTYTIKKHTHTHTHVLPTYCYKKYNAYHFTPIYLKKTQNQRIFSSVVTLNPQRFCLGSSHHKFLSQGWPHVHLLCGPLGLKLLLSIRFIRNNILSQFQKARVKFRTTFFISK